MEPNTNTPTTEETNVESTTEASTPNPEATDGAATPNPEAGTGAAPENTPVRNQPTNEAPEGYVSSDKFTASQQEAVRLNNLVKELGYDPKTGKRIQGAQPDTPAQTPTTAPTQPQTMTYEQAATQLPGFSTLTKEQQALVLNPRQAYKDFDQIRQQVAVLYDEAQTAKQIKELVAKPDYAELDQEAFKEFIYRDENIGVKSLETLAELYKLQQAKDAAKADEPKPEGGEPKSSGAKEIATVDGISEMTSEAAAELRRKNPRQYNKLARTGKLKIVDQ